MNNKKIAFVVLLILLIGGIVIALNQFSASKKEEITSEKSAKEEKTVNDESLNDKEVIPPAPKNEQLTKDESMVLGLSNITPIFEGDFKNFMYCPNGEALLFTDAKGRDLYIKTTESSTPLKLIGQKGIGNSLGWSKNCNTIYFREKTADYKIFVNSIDIATKEKVQQDQINPATELSVLAYSDTAYCLDQKTLAVYGEYQDKRWDITKEKGNYYKILVAPDNKKLLVHKGSNVYLYSTSGELIADLGRGIATSWSPDSKYCIGFIDESVDGHRLTGSELLLFDIDKRTTTTITATKDIHEMWPAWHPKKNEVVYSDYKNTSAYRAKIQL